ncbi:hypothetical protein [Chelativorans sp. Marseille-P2723]|uniref:hypothetical protein n=1 Tax=Chelativorans sp. Marseille-P2723 TaxID=2709133 RepID=UPI00156E244A|nr:hypothetical protein [Chelativorans sp. Marseille-P2723]
MPTEKTPQPRNLNRQTDLRESDLDADRMGRNSLQGDDQENVRNERQSQPGMRGEPDEIIESFEKMDKDKRARTDLGKGNRSGK